MNLVKALVLGDIIGEAGIRALERGLPELKKQYSPVITVANGENASEGFGCTVTDARRIASAGVDVITSGNHIWQKREIFRSDTGCVVLRPANFAGDVPGIGWHVFDSTAGKIAVINVQGRIRLSNINCPFRAVDEVLETIDTGVSAVIVDFHAEDTEEKEALGHYLAGRVSLVCGTHTHVQTADHRIIDGKTAYITDLGMTGPVDSVIGFDSTIAVERILSQMPLKIEVSDRRAAIRGIVCEIDILTGQAVDIELINYLPEM